jgi:hypothetical protein
MVIIGISKKLRFSFPWRQIPSFNVTHFLQQFAKIVQGPYSSIEIPPVPHINPWGEEGDKVTHALKRFLGDKKIYNGTRTCHMVIM